MTTKRVTMTHADSAGTLMPFSEGQEAFNALTAQIAKRRAVLAEWEAFDVVFLRRFNDDYLPLRKQYDEAGAKLLRRLDQSHGISELTKAERQTMGEVIAWLAPGLLASNDDPELAELCRRYSSTDDSLRSAGPRGREAAIEVTDSQGNAATASHDDILREIQEQLDAEEASRQRAQQRARESYHAERKKKAKPKPAEARARAEQAEVSLSIREIYRKLASALHPDREPDPVEHARKASLMQRVNQAYASKRLLDLLEIQLELEHIDHAALKNISDSRLKHWNTILKDQLEGLDRQIADVEAGVRARVGMHPREKISPKIVKRALAGSITQLREGTRAFEHDLRMFDEPERLKAWLKMMKRELAAREGSDV